MKKIGNMIVHTKKSFEKVEAVVSSKKKEEEKAHKAYLKRMAKTKELKEISIKEEVENDDKTEKEKIEELLDEEPLYID